VSTASRVASPERGRVSAAADRAPICAELVSQQVGNHRLGDGELPDADERRSISIVAPPNGPPCHACVTHGRGWTPYDRLRLCHQGLRSSQHSGKREILVPEKTGGPHGHRQRDAQMRHRALSALRGAARWRRGQGDFSPTNTGTAQATPARSPSITLAIPTSKRPGTSVCQSDDPGARCQAKCR
jgi:hypothetical protein